MRAQRRPGREPRRHPIPVPRSSRPAPSLNEGRGANPGDTPPARSRRRRRRPALNEGRGANPGDTTIAAGFPRAMIIAQRRPGREPRRHGDRPANALRDGARSTKAGARTPATRVTRCSSHALSDAAQRRPGREPRRHRELRLAVGWRAHRSTKAGARTPATPRGNREVPGALARSTKAGARTPATPGGHEGGRTMPWGRSTKAGARTPATRADAGRGRPAASGALNEGRGANPGDTRDDRPNMFAGYRAQRRPGREPRRHPRHRHPDRWRRFALNEGRGANPGDTRIRQALADTGLDRSTKAGARTPATRRSWARPCHH